jgi:transcriptional regulator with XRE-family HTH domain
VAEARKAIAERLRQAVKDSRKSIRWLQRTLAAQHVKGSSYATVHAYLQGRTEPPQDFLRTVARVLNVRPEWLIAGEGAATQAALRVESWLDPWEEVGTAAGKRMQRTRELLLKQLPVFERLPRTVRHLLTDALVRYEAGTPGRHVTDERLAELARQLWALMARPLRTWGFRNDLDPERGELLLQSRDFADYGVAMLHALMLALPAPGTAGPITKTKRVSRRERRTGSPRRRGK